MQPQFNKKNTLTQVTVNVQNVLMNFFLHNLLKFILTHLNTFSRT